mmetsp:Transcript_25435/g.69933  ORF Transcript_25435/g.69933 Transcript_25435/m.69933 type:complete len:222 (-) Transcript_25435:124-789(-)
MLKALTEWWRESGLASEIIPGRLFLGGEESARKACYGSNPQGITHVLNVCDAVVVSPAHGQTASGVVTAWVPIRDDGSDDIFDLDSAVPTQIWARCHAFLMHALAEPDSHVLVHCVAGVNRSPTIVIAWLMDEWRWPFDKTFHYVRSCRPCICPNPYYIDQLVAFQLKLAVREAWSAVCGAPWLGHCVCGWQEPPSPVNRSQRRPGPGGLCSLLLGVDSGT